MGISLDLMKSGIDVLGLKIFGISQVLADVKSKSVGLATIKSWVKTETPKGFFFMSTKGERNQLMVNEMVK